MKLFIAGDLSLQGRAKQCIWNQTRLTESFGGVRELLKGCDWSVVNLESPVTENVTPIPKDGPSLKNPPEVFDIIKFCGFNVVTLANNHLKDFGVKGVKDTLNLCKVNGLANLGAGISINEARKPLMLSDADFTIGILNVCEHESSIATEITAGAAPLDYPNLYNDITSLRHKADKIIVIIHGGREHYQLPTPRMKKEYHFIIDMGADVVVNHHQHCYSGYELYKGKPIFYGLGNFFFDNPSRKDEKWNQGLLLMLNIERDKTNFDLHPYVQCKNNIGIQIGEYASVESSIKKINEIISDDRMLNDYFKKMVFTSKPLAPFMPFGCHLFRALYYRGLIPSFISKKNKVLIENAISCEAHRDVLLQYFYMLIHKEYE